MISYNKKLRKTIIMKHYTTLDFGIDCSLSKSETLDLLKELRLYLSKYSDDYKFEFKLPPDEVDGYPDEISGISDDAPWYDYFLDFISKNGEDIDGQLRFAEQGEWYLAESDIIDVEEGELEFEKSLFISPSDYPDEWEKKDFLIHVLVNVPNHLASEINFEEDDLGVDCFMNDVEGNFRELEL